MTIKQTPLTPSERDGKAWRRRSPELQTRVEELLLTDMPRIEICRTLKITRSMLQRIQSEMTYKSTGTALPSAKPRTRCTGRHNCDCVACNANRLKTREVMLQLHAADEAARLGRFNRTQRVA